jgi:hypothetical protein
MNDNLDLALADFAAEYRGLHANLEPTLRRVQALLLDEAACRTRVNLLTAFGHALPPLVSNPRAWLTEHFPDVLLAIEEAGLTAAVKQDRLKFDRLDAAVRHPLALICLHQALIGEVGIDDADDLTPLADGTRSRLQGLTHATNMTGLIQQRKWEELRRKLLKFPVLRELLRHVGLEPGEQKDLLVFIVHEAQNQPVQSFRDSVLGWVERFAQSRGRTLSRQFGPSDWPLLIERAVVCGVLETPGRDEEEWERSFRQQALDRGVTTVEQLLAFHPSADQEPFLIGLLSQLDTLHEEAAVSWESKVG